jgi:hypothetical protein
MYPFRRSRKCPLTAARLMSQMTETRKARPPGPVVTLSDVVGATSINIRLAAVTGSLA